MDFRESLMTFSIVIDIIVNQNNFRMKRLIYLGLCLLVITGCKNDDDAIEEDANSDLALEIVGEWRFTSQETCDTGWRFSPNGFFQALDFDLCGNPCAGTPHAGDYEVNGDTLLISSGLTTVNNQITIIDNVLTIIPNDLVDGASMQLIFTRLECE